MAAAAGLLLMLLGPPLHVALGERLVLLVGRALGARGEAERLARTSTAALFALGLLAHLWGTFALALIGLPLWLAALLPLPAGLFPKRTWRELLSALRPPRDPGFWLWLLAVALLGATLFRVDDGITTLWKNNYGDLAFHLGMIASFVFGENFPPQYHVFAGERLSYPFFANLWSAAAWWPSPDPASLWRVFVFQWTALWCAIYALLGGSRWRLLPWALLLGGGSYFALGENSGERIAEGAPWTAFLSTIWVTQRGALLGACAALASLQVLAPLLGKAPPEGGERRLRVALAALLLALAPLAHAHIVLVAALWSGLVLALGLPRTRRDILLYALFSLPALLSLPWLLGKAGTLGFQAGWLTGDAAPTGLARLTASAGMWLRDAPVWLGLMALVWLLGARQRQLAALAALFAAGNLLRLAVWDWDQIKFFLGIYLVFLAVWSALPSERRALQLACALLLVPGAVELVRVLGAPELRTVYTAQDLDRARLLRESTRPDAVVACAPRHNAFATLSGRRLHYGYQATLWSHGIAHESRREELRNFAELAACGGDTCPTHLVWTDPERRYWNRETPGEGFAPTREAWLFAVER